MRGIVIIKMRDPNGSDAPAERRWDVFFNLNFNRVNKITMSSLTTLRSPSYLFMTGTGQKNTLVV